MQLLAIAFNQDLSRDGLNQFNEWVEIWVCRRIAIPLNPVLYHHFPYQNASFGMPYDILGYPPFLQCLDTAIFV